MYIVFEKQILYWNHFLSLEDDLVRTSRYVEFDIENMNVFSTEFTKIILAACAEVEVLLKQISRMYGLTKKKPNFRDYYDIIERNLPSLISESVIVDKYNFDISPFRNWSPNSKLEWHDSYNNLKHNRDKYYKEANLNNALTSIGALFTTVVHYYLSKILTKKDASEKTKCCRIQTVVNSLPEKAKLVNFTYGYC